MTEKTKYRKSPSKGEDTDVTRTEEGVAIKPKEYEAGNSQIGTDLVGYNRFTLQEIEFLDAYAEMKADLDKIKALTGMNARQCHNMLQKDHIKAEIVELQNVWRLNRKMTAEHAAAKHIELMMEMERDYKAIDDPVDRAKMANPRVKASETYLKAAGHFNHGQDTQDAQVVINIDLGGDLENEKKINISGEKNERQTD
jgi:hypothetical protein